MNMPESQQTAAPRQAPWVHVEDRTGSPRLVDQSGHQELQLNDTALAIWDLCDGATTVDEMAHAVVVAFGIDPVQALGDVQRVIADFRRLSLLTDSV